MVIALLIAAAAAMWPTTSRAVTGSVGQGPVRSTFANLGWAHPPTGRTIVVAAIVLGSALLLVHEGAAVAFAGAALGATGCELWRRLRTGRGRRLALEQIVAALRMLARELHAGADPVVAAGNTAEAATGEGALVVAELARAIGMGDHPSGGAGAMSARLRADGASRQPRSDPGDRWRNRRSASPEPRLLAVARLRSGWTLTRRHGIAFTPLIDALAAELAEHMTADSQRAGEVAGPRVSGYVMAGLPLLGLLLGAGMGADPVGVLFRTPVGNLLLVAGTALTCLGLLWSARIVARR